MFLDKRIIVLLLLESILIPFYVNIFCTFVALMWTYVMLEALCIATMKLIELARKVYNQYKPISNL